MNTSTFVKMSSSANNSGRKRKTFSSTRGDAVDLELGLNMEDDVFSVSSDNTSGKDQLSNCSVGKQRPHSLTDRMPDLLQNISTNILGTFHDQHERGTYLVSEKDGDSLKQKSQKHDFCRSKSVNYERREHEFGSISARVKEKRKCFRKSSGYGTGDSSQSAHSQVSQSYEAAGFNQPSPEVVSDFPKLSIFGFHNEELSFQHSDKNCSGNIPELSIFRQNSGDSFRVDSNMIPFDEFDSITNISSFSTVENQERSPSPSFGWFDEKVLEDAMKKGFQRKPNTGAARILTDVALMQDEKQMKECIAQYLLANPELETATDQCLSDLSSKIHQIFPDNSTPTPHSLSPQLIAQYMYMEIFDDCSNTQEQPQHSVASEFEADTGLNKINFNLVRDLERACRCTDQMCRDKKCCMVKQMLRDFKEMVKYGLPLKPVDVTVLYSLRAHSERCYALKCSVPWCSILLNIDPWNDAEAVSEIFNDCEGPTLSLSSRTESEPPKCLSKDDPPQCEHCQCRLTVHHILVDCPHLQPFGGHHLGSGNFKEGEDWCVLSPLNESHNVVMATDFHSGENATWVVKKAVLLDNNHQWNVYEKLSELRWTHIVRHYWVMEQNSDFFICTEFHHGGTLSQMIEYQALKPSEVAFFMKQILQGVQALHQRKIIYLNWTSCNMLLVDNRTVKISNLSLSVALDSDVEYNEIKSCLPPVILPPELLKKDPDLMLTSDSWGCACLVLELLSGKRAWHSLRHYSQEEIWEKLSRKASPPVPKDVGHLNKVFDACWKLKPADRKTVCEIHKLLI